MAPGETFKTVKPKKKPKCSNYVKLLNDAVWLKVPEECSTSLDQVRNVTNGFIKHIDDCKCSFKTSTKIVISSCFLEEFSVLFKNVTSHLDQIERLVIKQSEEKTEPQNYFSDFDNLKFESKFQSNINDQVSIKNFHFLIKPVLNAFKYLSQSLDDDVFEQCLSSELIINSNLLSNIITMYQIFFYYGMDNYAFESINLAISFIQKYKLLKSPIHCSIEEVQIIYCNMTKLLIHFGCFENAKEFFNCHFGDIESFNLQSTNSYALSQIYLLKCEVFLRSRKGKECAEYLKEFISSEYVNKNTIKRFILKIMALILASKFPSITYKYCTDFSEFCEPIQNILSICRRWNLFAAFYNNIESVYNDPLWVKFTIFNLFTEAADLYTNFLTNAGILIDASHYFKFQANLYTVTLNIVELSKLQLVGANIDFQNGFIDDVKLKVLQFKQLFSFKSDIFNPEMFNDKLEVGTKNLNQNDVTIDLTSPLEDVESYELARIKTAYDIYGELVKLNQRNFIDNGEEIMFESSISKPNLVKLVWRQFQHFQTFGFINKDAFYLCLKMVVIELMVQYENDSHIVNVVGQFNEMLSLLENYTINCLMPQIKRIVLPMPINIQICMREQIYHGVCGNIFWLISKFYIKVMINERLFSEALRYLNKIIDTSSYSFEGRSLRCDMFYYQALVIYKLLKTLNEYKSNVVKMVHDSLNQKKLSIEADNNVMPIVYTPKVQRVLNKNPNAPKHLKFNSETVKKYATNLLENVNKEQGLEGTRRNAPNLFSNANAIAPIKKRTRSCNENTKLKKEISKTKNNNLQVEDDLVLKFSRTCQLSDFSETNYFADLFDMESFKQNYKPDQYTSEDIKSLLTKIMCYNGQHPSTFLYNKVHYLSYKLSKLNKKNPQVLLFHLSESMNYIPFRYRNIILNKKKLSLGKCIGEAINFSYKDLSYSSYMEEFPDNWRFVQIMLLESNNSNKPVELLLSRFQVNHKPVFIKISNLDQKNVMGSFMDEFEEIMKGNSASMFEVERTTYWKLRTQFDERLKVLLESFEETYLGPFKALMLGDTDDDDFKLSCHWFKKMVLQSAKDLNYECSDTSLLNVFVESVIFSTEEQLEFGARTLFGRCEKDFLCNLLKLKKKYFKDWTTNEQILNLYDNVAPLGLILDKRLSQFPFESLPTARRMSQPFFRVPSLRVAANLYNNFKKSSLANSIDQKKGFYLLNPSNNLARTESFFKPKLEEISGWKGIIGKEPQSSELVKNFENSDLYLYIGHGSGGNYYRKVSKGLDSLNIKPISIIVGCSSARLNVVGKIDEAYGMSYRFLINGSPCYVGNLWDVTDKDIDMQSNRFLSYCIKYWEPSSLKITSLGKSLTKSRDECKLKYLTGCAPVIYGLPLDLS